MTENNLAKTNTQSAAHLLAILAWLVLFIIVTITVSVLVVDILGEELESPNSSFWPIMFACYCFGFILLAVAHSLKQHRLWARYVAGFFAFISIIAFPVGTVLGLFILSYIRKGWHER